MTAPLPTILVVDDDALYSDQLARSLRRRGFAVLLAHNHAQALAALAHKPSVALLDLRLAEESGMGLIAPLRAHSSDMTIVLLTGYASVATAVEAIKRGADDYLPKPATIEQILRAIENDAVTEVEESPETMLRLRRLEWEHVQHALLQTQGNISAAARMLGMHRRTLQRKLSKRPVGERGVE